MIYVNFTPASTVKEFMKQLFVTCPSYTYATRFVETFFDKKCRRQQCGVGRMRSFDDLLEIIKTYFPKYTAEELIHDILTVEIYCKTDVPSQLAYNGLRLLPQFHHCSGMMKIRLYYQAQIGSEVGMFSTHLSSVQKYNSLWSWKELLECIGIKYNNEIEAVEKVKNYMLKYSTRHQDEKIANTTTFD